MNKARKRRAKNKARLARLQSEGRSKPHILCVDGKHRTRLGFQQYREQCKLNRGGWSHVDAEELMRKAYARAVNRKETETWNAIRETIADIAERA